MDSRLRRFPPDRASAVSYGQTVGNATRCPPLAHRSAAAHKLHSAQSNRYKIRESQNQIPGTGLSLFLPGDCPNDRDHRTSISADVTDRTGISRERMCRHHLPHMNSLTFLVSSSISCLPIHCANPRTGSSSQSSSVSLGSKDSVPSLCMRWLRSCSVSCTIYDHDYPRVFCVVKGLFRRGFLRSSR